MNQKTQEDPKILTPDEIRELPAVEFPEETLADPETPYHSALFLQILRAPKSHPGNEEPVHPITSLCTQDPDNQEVAEKVMREKANDAQSVLRETQKELWEEGRTPETRTLNEAIAQQEARREKTDFDILEVRILLRSDAPGSSRIELLHALPGPPSNPSDHRVHGKFMKKMINHIGETVVEGLKDYAKAHEKDSWTQILVRKKEFASGKPIA